MKTPEEMAQVYIKNLAIYESEYPLARSCFIAGYKAAQERFATVSVTIPKENCEAALEAMKSAEQFKEQCVESTPALTTPKWISVKDRLPETNELCIVNTEWRAIVPALYGNESWIFDEGQGWSEKVLSYVSHWMPLPEAPKE
jgi:hypothetical protein